MVAVWITSSTSGDANAKRAGVVLQGLKPHGQKGRDIVDVL